MKRLCCLLLWAAPLTHAQTNPPPLDVVPSVLRAIDFFRAQAATNDEAWLSLPVPGQKVARYEKRLIHYKEVEITIPGRKYETYEVLVPGPTPGEPMRRETRSRVVGFDPSQDRKITQEVYDPKGPIVREQDVPIYEKDTSRQWRLGGLGNNGWAIYALRRCGIPGNDPLLLTPAENLTRIIQTFGMPDYTVDLAGLTAGFAVLPGADYAKLTELCASKLLDAQLPTGLWSPLGVNIPMLSAFLKVMTKIADERKLLQTELATEQSGKKSKTKIKRLEEEIARLDRRSEELVADSKRITQVGLRMFDALGHPLHGGRVHLTEQGETLVTESWPYVAHNQACSDLESTALALHALRVAFENGRLPGRTWRPDPPKPAGPGQPTAAPEFPAPREARTVISLAAKALTGQTSELNFHQPVTDFLWLKAMPQLKPNTSPKLPQPVTLASTVRAAAALANIQMMQTGQPRPTALENPAVQSLLPDMLNGKPLANSNDVRRAPFDVLWQTTSLRVRGKPTRTDFTTWNEIADWLMKQQAPHGGWGRRNAMTLMASTSLLALRDLLPEIKPTELALRYDQPHLSPAYLDNRNFLYCRAEHDATYFTLGALLFLSDGLPPDWKP